MKSKESNEVLMGREKSLPVQSRVNIVDLANLDRYFTNSGCQVNTMSKLVNWSIGLLVEVLDSNNALKDKFESLVEAYQYLNFRGLHQPSMIKLARNKLSTSLKFESMRGEGVDPKEYDKRHFNTLHGNEEKARPWKRDKGMVPFNGKVISRNEENGMHFKDDIEEALKRAEEEKERERKEEVEAAIESMRERGVLAEEPKLEQLSVIKEGASQEELNEHARINDNEITKRENAPFDIQEMMQLQEERINKDQ